MSKSLIIAEKPSVAGDIAKTLGGFKQSGQVYENDKYIVASAVGHLVGLIMPEDIDKKLKAWTMATLPIVPEVFGLKPIPRTKDKLTELKKLIARKDVDNIINACDAGREGELIFTYIYQLVGKKKSVQRLWMQSMTKQSIINAFANLRSSDEMKPLQDSARSRSESDWLIGINGTRATTKKLMTRKSRQVATVGRVQTPTLALVYDREMEIRNFESQPYWKVKGEFQINLGKYEGVLQKRGFRKGDNKHDRIDRMWEENEVVALLKSVDNCKNAPVVDKKKRSKQNSSLLYDLTTLQREANKRFGYSATRTLRLAQALYERHKILTYPRTDSRALPEDYIDTCKETLRSLTGEYSKHAEKVLSNNWVFPNKRIFNNAKISDHFAIIPTGERIPTLANDEANIFNMVTKRFISIFYPAAEYDITTRITSVGEHDFKTEGKILVKPGWLEVYGKTAATGENMPAICEADGNPSMAEVLTLIKEDFVTKPPPRYDEGTLLAAMEGAGKFIDDEELAEAMKEKGLGTPATRAQIIEHLCNSNYMERIEGKLAPTQKACDLIEFLKATDVTFLTKPELTGEWEYKLNQVERGELSREEFMKGIIALTEKITNQIKDWNWEEEGTDTTIISPTDNKPMLEKLKSYASQDGVVVIYKNIGNRRMTEEDVQTLLTDKETKVLEGFVSKAGKPYSAKLILNSENKIEFVFEDSGNGEPTEQDGHVKTLVKAMANITWAPAQQAGKRTFDDSSFFDSLKEQSEKGRHLSERQFAALARMAVKYKDQIKGFEPLATEVGINLNEEAEAKDPKVEEMLKFLSKVENWNEPVKRGKRVFDDKEFYQSIDGQYNSGKKLSPRQVAALGKVIFKYKNKTSGEDGTPSAPVEIPKEVLEMFTYLEKIESWAEPVKSGRKTYDDKAFFESLKQQTEQGRVLSSRQLGALQKMIDKYKDQ